MRQKKLWIIYMGMLLLIFAVSFLFAYERTYLFAAWIVPLILLVINYELRNETKNRGQYLIRFNSFPLSLIIILTLSSYIIFNELDYSLVDKYYSAVKLFVISIVIIQTIISIYIADIYKINTNKHKVFKIIIFILYSYYYIKFIYFTLLLDLGPI